MADRPDRADPPAAAAAAPDDSPDAWLHRLEWTVLRRLDGLLQGAYRTLWRGGGLDLADLREYQPQDDVRHIDWNVTARLQVPHVRQFTEDRELTAWFLLDLSGSVDFGSVALPGNGSGDAAALRTKRGLAIALVAALARLLTRQGNRIGAVLYAPGRPLQVLPPATGRLQVLRLLRWMQQPAPAAAAVAAPARRGLFRRAAPPPVGPGTRLSELLEAAEGLLRRRAMVFVVSDFISEPGWTGALGRLARRHEVLAVRLYDPAELELPAVGMATLQDAETGEQLFVDTDDPGLRERFAALAARAEAELRQQLGQAGVDALELATEEALMAALLRFVLLRRQRQRAAPGRHLAAALSTLTETPA